MTKQPLTFESAHSQADALAAKKRNRSKSAHSSSMQLTRAADYALRAMIHLASQPTAERALLPELSRATGAPENFLSKVLQCLCRAGLAASHRGQCGGFEILRPGLAATVADVIQSIEGPISLNVCLDPEPSRSRSSFCPAHPVWVEAQTAMLAVLNAKTVADLAAIASSKRCSLAGQ